MLIRDKAGQSAKCICSCVFDFVRQFSSYTYLTTNARGDTKLFLRCNFVSKSNYIQINKLTPWVCSHKLFVPAWHCKIYKTLQLSETSWHSSQCQPGPSHFLKCTCGWNVFTLNNQKSKVMHARAAITNYIIVVVNIFHSLCSLQKIIKWQNAMTA